MENKKINKGTGAGGKNTTLHGGKYEKLTCIEDKLIKNGFEKKFFCKMNKLDKYYYEKIINGNTLIYVTQSGLKTFMEEFYNLSAIRKPDEAFIIIDKNKKVTIKILEKKYQKVQGSVDTKLWAGHGIKREYELYYKEQFKIEYAFSLSKMLENNMKSNIDKWVLLNKILAEDNIMVFYSSDDEYYNKVFDWGFNLELKNKKINKEIEV